MSEASRIALSSFVAGAVASVCSQAVGVPVDVVRREWRSFQLIVSVVVEGMGQAASENYIAVARWTGGCCLRCSRVRLMYVFMLLAGNCCGFRIVCSIDFGHDWCWQRSWRLRTLRFVPPSWC